MNATQPADPDTAIDPVCGMEVETDGAPYVTERNGMKYYFCGRGCMLDFQEDPEHYLDPSYTPSM